MRRRLAVAAILAATGLASFTTTAASAPERGVGATVRVVSFAFKDDDVGVKSGQRIKFKWSGNNTSPHNVTLRDGPDGVGVRDFASETGTSAIRFVPKFVVPGRYMFRCTIHPDLMRLRVTVSN